MKPANYKKLFRTVLMFVAFLLAASRSRAGVVRVTTWDLQSTGTSSNGMTQSDAIVRAADALRNLNPDVIILDNVVDRDNCQLLVDALKPENYQIAACSSFRSAAHKKNTAPQVAVLSKTRALLGWSEAWQNEGTVRTLPGGFAFAEIQIGDENLGLLVAHLGLDKTAVTSSDLTMEQQLRSSAAGQLLKTVESFRNWASNRIDAVFLAGDLQASEVARAESRLAFSSLANNGFQMALDWLPGKTPSSVDYIFTRGTGSIANVVFSQIDPSPGQPVTCDYNFFIPKPVVSKPRPEAAPTPVASTLVSLPAPAKPPLSISNAAAPPVPLARAGGPATNPGDARNQPALTNSPSQIASLVQPAAPSRLLATNAAKTQTVPRPAEPASVPGEPGQSQDVYWRVAGVFAIGFLVFLILWKFLFARKSPPLVSQLSTNPVQPVSDPGVALAQNLSSSERAGVVSNLTLWLKQKFVQKLVTDRSQLIATQQAATLAVMAIDQRLTNVEKQIKQRNQEYEQRIEELQKELAVAQEENRELIRSKIEMLKLEMAKAAGKPASLPSRN